MINFNLNKSTALDLELCLLNKFKPDYCQQASQVSFLKRCYQSLIVHLHQHHRSKSINKAASADLTKLKLCKDSNCANTKMSSFYSSNYFKLRTIFDLLDNLKF